MEHVIKMDSIKVDLQSLLEIQQNLLLNPNESVDSLSNFIDCMSVVVAIITTLATGFTAFIAYKALVYAKKEYSLHKQTEMASTLAAYNERYATSPYIENVIKYLISKEERIKSIKNKVEVLISELENSSTTFQNTEDLKRQNKNIEKLIKTYSTKRVIDCAEKIINEVNSSEALLSNENVKSTLDNIKEELEKEKKSDEISTNDKEMFMRFFEEIQYTIDQGGLTEKMVYEMFSYYAIKIYDLNTEFIDDFNEYYWCQFRRFGEKMKRIDQRIKDK